MRLLPVLLALTGLAAALPVLAKTPDEELAKALEGRAEGAPVDCLNLRDIRSSRIIAGIGILYETNNRTVYLNRPDAGASSLRWGQTLVTDTHSSRLCSIDTVKLYDTSLHMQSGFVGLGKFVPYVKPKS